MMPLSNIPPYDEIYLGQDTAPMERVLDNLELFQNNPSRIPENISEAFKSWTIDEVQWTHDQAQWESAIQSAAQRVRFFNLARNPRILQSIPDVQTGSRLSTEIQASPIGRPNCQSGFIVMTEDGCNFYPDCSNPEHLTLPLLLARIGDTLKEVKEGILACVRVDGAPPSSFNLTQGDIDGTKEMTIGDFASQKIPLVSVKHLPDIFHYSELRHLTHIRLHGLLDLKDLPESLHQRNLPFLQEVEVHNCPSFEERDAEGREISLGDHVELIVHCDSELSPLLPEE
ncbi:hypothetical protein CAGGBEG34_260004 [Candidatus Glomeribacter gigasporarum BEG34]|uniref:Uncharacterized protein n=1 Tax=Candidatus Glomeribacter gigasporarum BEG34 TaxID=1070319 RepID=G2J9V9_9BURK|nr:hypothetical protein [Candidatus Glomeribacter gigasporarum]CCD29556.1 hypothetical protein CAGGBEG34_260004 [Candidatus Glomeribacter gigasporarum BEG34]